MYNKYTKDELLKWYDEDYCIKMIKRNVENYRLCKVQTDEIVKLTIERNCWVAMEVTKKSNRRTNDFSC